MMLEVTSFRYLVVKVKKMESKIAEMICVCDETVSVMQNIDYFISALNCDYRGYCIFDILSKHHKFEEVILFDYKKLRNENNMDDIMKLYDSSSDPKPSLISCDGDDDVLFINSKCMEENDIVGIDITNFCIPDLFRIMYVLKKVKKIKTIYAFYTEPKYYLQHYNVWGERVHELSERNYNVLDEYFVSATPDKTLLVCFLGFEYMVSKYVSESANVKDTIVINGFPSYYPKLKDISLANNYELVSTLNPKNIYRSKANDPFSAYNTLKIIQHNYSDYVLNVCVLGTKPMALGACIFALENETSVKVSYPSPKKYKNITSKEASEMWCYVF